MGIVGQEQIWFLALLLTIPRILGAFIAMPFLGSSTLPGLVRNSIIIILSAFAVPITMHNIADVPLDSLTIAFIIIKEMSIGFMMGYLISLPFWAVATSGFIIDLQSGKMSAVMFSSVLTDQTSPLGDFLTRLSVTLLFSTGGFLIIIDILLKSYQVWPVHSFFPNLDIQDATVILDQFTAMFYMAALIAFPISATMFLAEMGSAIIARYVPTLNIFILLMPIKAAIAALLMVYYIRYIARYLMDSFLKFNDSFKLLEGLFS